MKLLVANWKLNPVSVKEAVRIASSIEAASDKGVEVAVCPSFVHAAAVKGVLKKARLGAQNVSVADKGAYTGEVSARMLKDAGVLYVIVGHSERRKMGETSDVVQMKVKKALTAGLRVILCVGEENREDHGYVSFIKEEVVSALRGTPQRLANNVVIAYEPIWAVGSDMPDTPASMLEMAIYLRKIMFDLYGKKVAESLRVLYGGSVIAKNAAAFFTEGGVDGLLVGRSSLDPKQFAKIIKIAGQNGNKELKINN